MVVGMPAEELVEVAPYIHAVYAQGREGKETDLEGLDIEGMLAAIAADCQAGNMAQFSGYHHPVNYDLLKLENIDYVVTYLELGWDREVLELDSHPDARYSPTLRYTNLRVYASCTNTLKWMEENGLLTEEMQREMIEKFDGAYFAWTN